MSVHIAILKRPYLDAVLAGTKTIESRLSKNAGPPFNQVFPNERIYLKESSGPFRAFASASVVHSFDNLKPPDIQRLRQRFDSRIGGDDDYWQGRAACRHATLIELSQPQPIDTGPAYRVAYMRAWYVLPNAADPIRDIPLTAGAIKHRYVPLPADAPNLQTQTITLAFPDGQQIQTDSYRGQRFRWRGWGQYFDAHHLKPGDDVRLIFQAPKRYAVQFIRA